MTSVNCLVSFILSVYETPCTTRAVERVCTECVFDATKYKVDKEHVRLDILAEVCHPCFTLFSQVLE
jgi:hypothetical protein